MRLLLWLADALLVALALLLVSQHAGQASGLDLALGIAALATGAALGCAACLRNPFAPAPASQRAVTKPAPAVPQSAPEEKQEPPSEHEQFQPHYAPSR
jgi:hypothetical protein